MLANNLTPLNVKCTLIKLVTQGKVGIVIYAHESCKDVKACYKECKKELAKTQLAYNEKDRLEELEEEKKEMEQLNSKQVDRIKQLEEVLKQSEADSHQLRLNKEKYVVEADGISIGHKEPDIQAILKAIPNVDPASSDTFMETYENLFDKRYPYVDKVAHMYLLDPIGLQNIIVTPRKKNRFSLR
ncbi:hypothetical protein Tco_1135131 [Tanacetum coccineum]